MLDECARVGLASGREPQWFFISDGNPIHIRMVNGCKFSVNGKPPINGLELIGIIAAADGDGVSGLLPSWIYDPDHPVWNRVF
jgi:hypothetical protein